MTLLLKSKTNKIKLKQYLNTQNTQASINSSKKQNKSKPRKSRYVQLTEASDHKVQGEIRFFFSVS